MVFACRFAGAGSATVGKSTLIKRYCENRFVQKYIPTIGIDYGVKPVRVLGHELKVNFFDTSGRPGIRASCHVVSQM